MGDPLLLFSRMRTKHFSVIHVCPRIPNKERYTAQSVTRFFLSLESSSFLPGLNGAAQGLISYGFKIIKLTPTDALCLKC